jgi:photosystem II stability/assembly factor-like uncharacterized protein
MGKAKNLLFIPLLVSFFLFFLAVIFPMPADAGINEWTGIGPEGAEVYALAIDPSNPNILYAGTNYGVFKSSNAGTSWTDANTVFRSPNGWLYVSALAIDPLNPNIVYAVGGGVFKSTDAGTSWIDITPRGLWGTFPVASLAINPLNPSILYVGGWGDWEGLIFVSYDAGGYWFIIHTGSYGIIESLAIDPSNPNIVYAGYAGNNVGGVLKRTDAGGGWVNISGGFFNGYVTAIAIDPSNPNVIYAVAGGVFKSTDAGASWISIGSSDLTPPELSRYVYTLAIDPLNPNILYAGTNFGVFKSTNAGTSWTPMNEGLSNLVVHALAIDPSNPNILYAGTNGGVFKYQVQEGPPPLPDKITFQDPYWTQIMSYFAQRFNSSDQWPVFLNVSMPDYNITANIVLIASNDPITDYKIVRIKTNTISDLRDLKLAAVLPSSPGGCIEKAIADAFQDWRTNFWEELGKEILGEIFPEIGIISKAQFLLPIIACTSSGYTAGLQGWSPGQDFLVYLPIGVNLTLQVGREICKCAALAMAAAPWLCDCPAGATGVWQGTISENLNEISVNIQQTSPNWLAKIFRIHSPAELRLYDSQGRLTGLVNGLIKQDIPNSLYDPANEAVGIFFSTDSFLCEVAGTGQGTYRLTAVSIENKEPTTFVATDIPISPNEIFHYVFDWQALSRAEQRVTVHIDYNGDGIYESTITAGNQLTHDEFVLQTETVLDLDPNTLNLRSQGNFITAYIELPPGYNIAQIDISSIRLNGTVAPLAKPVQVGASLMVKFYRADIVNLVRGMNLTYPANVSFTVTGKVAGVTFEGSSVIRITNK